MSGEPSVYERFMPDFDHVKWTQSHYEYKWTQASYRYPKGGSASKSNNGMTGVGTGSFYGFVDEVKKHVEPYSAKKREVKGRMDEKGLRIRVHVYTTDDKEVYEVQSEATAKNALECLALFNGLKATIPNMAELPVDGVVIPDQSEDHALLKRFEDHLNKKR